MFYCFIYLLNVRLFCYSNKNHLLISITKNIVDGDLALPWSKVDVHIVSFNVSNHLCLVLVPRLASNLVPEVDSLLEVMSVATLETLTGGGKDDWDCGRVAVRTENSHRH